MNQRIQELAKQTSSAFLTAQSDLPRYVPLDWEKFAQLIQEDMYRKVIASILITDVVMEEKGQKPTSEDYIQAINKDFGVK
jgi:hypothetical protein